MKDQFGQKKAKFIIKNGEWLHKGNENRYVLLLDSKIIGYFGFIPTKLIVNDKQINGIWWTDLIISHEYRGRGYQTIIDNFVKSRSGIKLGFCNNTAAKIHSKHNWKVYTNSKILLLPIDVNNIPVLKNNYLIKYISKFILYMVKKSLHKFKPRWSIIDKTPKPGFYSKLFLLSLNNSLVNIDRNKKYLNWRYFNSPYFGDYKFYFCDISEYVKVALIARIMRGNNGPQMRIVELFGTIRNRKAVKDLIKTVVSDAIKLGVVQITIMETNLKLQSLLFQCGFLLFRRVNFVCQYNDAEIRKSISRVRLSFGDSDNDFLD